MQTKYIAILALLLFSWSCRNEDKDPLPIDSASEASPYLTLEVEKNFLDPRGLSLQEITGVLTDRTGDVQNYDINVSLYRQLTGDRSDTVFVKRVTEFGEFSISALEVVAALDSTLEDLKFGDRLDFVCSFSDGEAIWRADGGGANIGPDLLASEVLPQPFIYSAYVACEVVQPFVGLYEMRQIAGGFQSWGPNFGAAIVNVSAPGPLERRWEADYLGFTVDFRVSMVCGEVEVPYTQTGIGCGGPGLNWVQDSELGTYNPNNDRVFTIRIIDNVDNGCGAGVNPGTVIEMRKVEEEI